jgi:hypothetical protein
LHFAGGEIAGLRLGRLSRIDLFAAICASAIDVCVLADKRKIIGPGSTKQALSSALS